MKKGFPDIDTEELFKKLKQIVSADMDKLFQKVVICKSPLENVDANRLTAYTKILTDIRKDERQERLSLVDTADNPFDIGKLKILSGNYSADQLLKLAASEEEEE